MGVESLGAARAMGDGARCRGLVDAPAVVTTGGGVTASIVSVTDVTGVTGVAEGTTTDGAATTGAGRSILATRIPTAITAVAPTARAA